MNFNLEDKSKLFDEAIKFTNSHYENFPVISFFIKKTLRKFVAVIYQYARQADNIADEGNFTKEERLQKLKEYEKNLNDSLKGKYANNFWESLNYTVKFKNLSTQNLFDLLTAFKQDVVKNRYKDFEELNDYCKNSANPVGRIILELHNLTNENLNILSDKICTALQLTNFYQDVSIDLLKDRIYLPIAELEKFNLTENDIINKNYSDKFVKMMKVQIKNTQQLFSEGRELLKFLPLRLKLQILVTIKGGEEVLKKIKDIEYNTLNLRPKLSKVDFIKLFVSSIIFWR